VVNFSFKRDFFSIIAAFILIFSHALVYADDSVQSVKNSQLEQFRGEQKCYVQAVANEAWEVGLDCAINSLRLGRELYSSGHKNITALTHNYGLMLAKNKQYKRASEELKKVYKLYKKTYGPQSEAVAWLLIDLADSQVKLDSGSASKNYVKGLKILASQESYQPLNNAKIALDASVHLSSLLLTRSAGERAIRLAKDAYDVYYKTYGAAHRQTALAALTLGKLRYLKKDYKKAVDFLQRSLVNPDTGKYAHGILVEIYTKTGRSDLAEKHKKVLASVLPRRGESDNYIPVYVESPKYPNRALRRGKEGYAVVSLTITEQGTTRQPVLVEEYPEGWSFGKEALKVVDKLKYAPRVENGKAVEVPGVLYKYSFKINK
jgi:TonB family protein